ncbi:MAG: hypothetical protein JJE29_04260 [Peptostreptococcaceae bacterium]|nr:hypothetical protein [Peptostreptococcaceae bacterium]
MGILDALFSNNGNIGKGFEFFTKGNSYAVAYNAAGEVVAYTTALSAGKQIVEKYIEGAGIDETFIRYEEEFYRSKDGFIEKNGDRQICIVDKELMLKKDVEELMEKVELIPDRTNRWMNGLDKYTKK